MIPRVLSSLRASAARFAAPVVAMRPVARGFASASSVTTSARGAIVRMAARAGGRGAWAGRAGNALLPLLLAGGAAAAHIVYTDDGEMVLFSGNANKELAAEIATMVGVQLGNITVSRFADGEVNVAVHDNVRGKDVYIIQVRAVSVDVNATRRGLQRASQQTRL